MRISGSVALVTGASSGLGRQIAIELARRGSQVVVHGRDRERVAAVAKRTDGVGVVADLADATAVARLSRAALDVADRVDILVNNAGVGWWGPLVEMPASQVERLVAVDLTGQILLTRALLPGMIRREAGHVGFVSSIAARTGVPGEAVYAAAKAGLDALAESLRLELAGSGVSVGVVVPGVVDTPFFDRRGRPYTRRRPRPLPPEAVASRIVDDIATGRTERYAPRWLRFPVALKGISPQLYRGLAARWGERMPAGEEEPPQ